MENLKALIHVSTEYCNTHLGKHHYKKISVHLGIAQIAIGPPPPHSNGHSVAPIFGQNDANARLYLDISPKNRCHKPSWQGFRPPPPNGQCPNEQRFSYGGASLISSHLGVCKPWWEAVSKGGSGVGSQVGS